MADKPVLVERDGGVVTLTLNRPDIRNAMDPQLTEQFSAAVDALRGDSELRAVVVTGAGQSFCAGGDLSWIKPGPGANVPEMRAKMRAFYPKFLGVRSLDVPVIAAINGHAVGAGLCLAMACDLRIAGEGAKLSAPFTKLGMHPGMAATYLLPKLIGHARAADLLYTSRTILAPEALTMGLVNRVVPDGDLLAAAKETAAQIAANAPLPMRLVKRALALAERGADLDAMLDYEGLAQPVTMGTQDLFEGLTAVREKRAPNFKDA